MSTIINGERYEKISINRTNNVVGMTEQVEELFNPKNMLTQNNILNEIWDSCRDTFYIDECGQIFVTIPQGLKYIGKCKL